MYKKFIKQGEKSGQAIHRAASTHRHVNEKELRKVIDALGSLNIINNKKNYILCRVGDVLKPKRERK